MTPPPDEPTQPPQTTPPPQTLGVVGDETFSATLAEMRALRDELQRFLLEYQFALKEVETKIAILRDEFLHMHDYVLKPAEDSPSSPRCGAPVATDRCAQA